MKLEIDGIQYYVDLVGKGYPLVLLHGFTGNGETWLPFCNQWTTHSTLIMVDIIGHGKTESPAESKRYQMDRAVNDLFLILQQLNIDKADFLGYSMGGRLALSFAAKYPEKVRKLVLESASPGLKMEVERDERRQRDEKLATSIIDNGIKNFVDNWEGIPLFQSQRNLPLQVQNQIREQRLTNSVIGLANSLIGMGTGSQRSLWDQLYQVSCDVLLVTGKLDEKFCKIATEMLGKLKNSKMMVVEGCGHAIHVEQARKFGTIVSEFVQFT